MTLFRLVSHAKNNKLHLDKFIAIEGVPERMLFETKEGKKILKAFLAIDVPENIPKDIRQEFYKDEKVTRYIAPYEKGANAIIEEKPLYSIVIDYAYRQGQELWDSIARMIDDQTPRDRKVVEPIIVAKDHRSGFTITAEDVPVVTLKAQEAPVPEKKVLSKAAA